MNGSLDAQYVEVHGLITSVSAGELTLLTPEGKLRVRANADHPMPRLPLPREACVDSVVRIRGCVTAEFDAKTGQIKAGEIYINPGTVSIEEPRPADPFALPARRASDLLLFDARASALQRTRVAGQIIHARERRFCLLDGSTGFRVITKEPVAFRIGDRVEAVGFPQLGGPSPVLQEALLRTTGHDALPEPVSIASEDLLNSKHDSTLVRVEALLESDTSQQGERILELQAGPRHFLARLNSDRERWTPLSPGSRLQLTGVYSSAREERVGDSLDSFELWLNNAAAITVLEQPPWWTVRRAVTMAAALAGGLGLALVWITLLRRKVEERTAQLQNEIEERQKVEQHRAMEQERTRVARDLHDELGAGLTEVGILGSLAKNPSIPSEQKTAYLDQLTSAARSLVTGLDEIVWAVNPQYDSVPSLASYYSLFAQRFLNLAGIACRLEIAESLPEHPLESRLRHGIFLAFKEALNNVVRHSGATEVRLQIEVARNELMISITDNGRGLPPGNGAPGSDGLAGMHERMQQLGGACEVQSRAGEGTTVRFRLPLGAVASGNGGTKS
jgi:signal transduction histidine kinase